MALVIPRSAINLLGFDFAVAYAAFVADNETHALTVDVPAPRAHPYVEQAYQSGGYTIGEDVTPPGPAPEVPTPEPYVPEKISRRQFYEGLVEVRKITWDECLQVQRDGTLPPHVRAILDEVPDIVIRNRAESRLIGAGEFYRSDQFVMIFAAVEQMDDDAVDDFWRLCALL